MERGRTVVVRGNKDMANMRQAKYGLLGLALAVLAVSVGAQTDEARIPFSDPSKPGRVEVSMMHGKIDIEGYDGRDVIVITKSGDPARQNLKREPPPESEGLRRVGPAAASLDAEEQGNVLRLNGSALLGSMDVTVRVPTNSAVKVNCMNCNDLAVSNVGGGLELENLAGTIRATGISGAVSAHSLNGKVLVKMRRVEPGTALAFTSMNGEIDVTLPVDTKADILLDNLNGEIYTDFDLRLQSSRGTDSSDERPQGGSHKVRIDVNRNLKARLNGGGATIRFKNIYGNILIRKGQ